jgi:hypothetical protein
VTDVTHAAGSGDRLCLTNFMLQGATGPRPRIGLTGRVMAITKGRDPLGIRLPSAQRAGKPVGPTAGVARESTEGIQFRGAADLDQ